MYAMEIDNQTRKMTRDELGNPLFKSSSDTPTSDALKKMNEALGELTRAYEETVECWSKTLDQRCGYPEGFTGQMSDLCMRLARRMGADADECIQIRRGVLLHHVGKMGIPEKILRKSKPLTNDERALLANHPVNAYQLLATIPFLAPALDIPRYQSERWDGSGFPLGLKRDQIPLAARIFAVVQYWEVGRAGLAGQPIRSSEEILMEIQSKADVDFDPGVVQGFLELIAIDEPELAAFLEHSGDDPKEVRNWWRQNVPITNPFIPA
jgi:HD-GYP domain-containing protein (c-di-GMP phosphodiesterase class II)